MELDSNVSTGDAVALGGAVLVVVGAFLQWVTRNVDAGVIEVSSSTAGSEGLGVLTIVLALVAVGVVLIKDLDVQQSVATGIVGLSVFLVSGWKVLDISDPASPGVGLYLTLLGGVMTLGAGILTHRSDESDRTTRLGTT